MSTTEQYPDFSGLTFETVWAMFKESDKKFAQMKEEHDEIFRRMDRDHKKLRKELGHIGKRFGEVVEHFIKAGVIERFNELGYHFEAMVTRFQLIDPNTRRVLTELDIVMENGESIVVVETKADPSLSDVKKYIRQMQMYREYRNRMYPNDTRKLYGAMGAAVFPDDVQQAALEAGVYIIVQSGKTVKIDVPEGFQPTAF